MNPILQKDMEDIFSRNNSWERLEKSTVLLTGAYGMLASYIVHFLLYVRTVKNINVKLIAVVRNKDKFVQRFGHAEGFDSIEIIQNDLSEPIEIEEDVDYIIHAASLASPQYYSVCPVDVLKPNTIGNYHLLELATTKKVKSYLLFSSCDVYETPKVMRMRLGIWIHLTYITVTAKANVWQKPCAVHSGYSIRFRSGLHGSHIRMHRRWIYRMTLGYLLPL